MSTGRQLRVLVVEDSLTSRALLVDILGSDEEIVVVGEASNGEEAVDLASRLRPDIMVMDIEMPVMDGLEATKRIMVSAPCPIIIVSARYDPHNVEVALQAVRVGALAVLPKPAGPAAAGFSHDASRLVTLTKALAEVRVVRRRWVAGPVQALPESEPHVRGAWHGSVAVVGVAASTGGPAALYRFLEVLPPAFGAPVLVVQHIVEGFIGGLVSWLGSGTALPVCVAREGQRLEPGTVYVAPDGYHLGVRPGRHVALSDGPPLLGFRPSASALFASMADHIGEAAAGVVLTGMGSDGLTGIRALRRAGGLVLAQDEQTSAVFGMPRAVIDDGLAHYVGPVDELASSICRFVPRRLI